MADATFYDGEAAEAPAPWGWSAGCPLIGWGWCAGHSWHLVAAKAPPLRRLAAR